MTQTSAGKTNPVFLVTGLILVGLGLVTGQAALDLISSGLEINFRLEGIEGAARIWGLKIVFIAVGLPLLLYNIRSKPWGRLLFDLSMGLIFTVALLLGIEGLFYGLNAAQPAAKPNTSTVSSEVYVELDDALGYQLKPDLQVAVTQTMDSQTIYDVIYSMDEHGRRITPVRNPEDRTKFILFFGGSFTFGAGVNDDETLPAYVGDLAPDYRPYNYGVPGYGTQQLFIKLHSDELVAEVPQRQGLAVYGFICAHIKRVIGSSTMQNEWGRLMPYYHLDASGRLVRAGDLISSRPLRAALFSLVEISQTADYFNLGLPRINDDHLRLTARLIEEAAGAFEQKFGSEAFYVLFYPSAGCAPRLIPYLEEANVNYVDYSTLFGLDEADLWIPDGHPTAPGHRIVAEHLVTDLGLTGRE